MPFTSRIPSQYTPPTGFGGFSMTLDPNGTLDVQVRVHWDFQAGDGGVAWTPGDQGLFKNTFKQNIPTTWNRKWKLRCTNPAYAGDFEPVFTIQDGTPVARDLPFEIHNVHGLSYLHAGQRKLVLHKYDNLMYDDIPGAETLGMSRMAVRQGILDRLDQIVQTVQGVTMDRGAGGAWSVSPASRVALQQAAADLVRIQQGVATVPIILTASSGAAGKADALVNAVVAELQAAGVNPGLFNIQRNATKTRPKFRWPRTPHKQHAVVHVDVDQGQWKHVYRVADHEFGHCLGLPDEYTLYDPNSTIGGSHTTWRNLCQRAGVQANPIPANLGGMVLNSSIMSNGWVTCACHYVTIWDAVTRMTGGAPWNIRANEWQIVRGTETQDVA